MKSIKKFLFIMVALAATLAFVSCSNGSDGPSTVAVYKNVESDAYGYYEMILTFFDDGTLTAVGFLNGLELDSASGTYTGDPTKDGIVVALFPEFKHQDVFWISNGKLAVRDEDDGEIYFTRQ